jgi:hypothetical protein
MFDHKHYVPVLKWKQGEQQALQELSGPVKSFVTPLIEIPPVPWNYTLGVATKTIDQHLLRTSDQLYSCWGCSDILFLDMHLVPPGERMSDGRHPLKYVFDEARLLGVSLIPVTGLGRDTHYQTAVREISSVDRRGICLRISDEHLDDDDLESLLRDTLDAVASRRAEVDLILDLADISGENPRRLSRYLVDAIRRLERFRSWRTITLVSSSFPRDLSAIPRDAIDAIPRKDWEVWNHVLSSSSGRKPSFGDYAIQHPEPPEIDPRIMRMSASIRYTADTEWLIVKGRNVKTYGYGQYHDLCRHIVADPRFYGEDFSWGDEYIAECSRGETGTGNATTWRRVGTSHHIKVVCEQIASLP